MAEFGLHFFVAPTVSCTSFAYGMNNYLVELGMGEIIGLPYAPKPMEKCSGGTSQK